MTRRAQRSELPHWQIKSVRVRAREGPERVRRAYRLLLQPAEQPVDVATPETCQYQSQLSEGA